MEQEKLIKISYGGKARWVVPEDVQRIRAHSEMMIQYFLERGYPKEIVEKFYQFQILEE